MADFPNSFKDPTYASLDAQVTEKLGLPPGLLDAIRTRGEKSNHDQESSAKAKTVYQIIPATRQAAIDKWGIDPYLSPENASEVAGLLLKDSLARNGGNAPLAVAEYVGGTDKSNWGPTTKAYVQRVTGQKIDAKPVNSLSLSARLQQQQTQQDQGSIANVYQAYKDGRMTPEDAQAFEQEVNNGGILLPRGASLNSQPKADPMENVAAAYRAGKMSPEDAKAFEELVKSGQVQASLTDADKIPGQTVQAPAATDTTPTRDTSWAEKAVGTLETVGGAAVNAIPSQIGAGIGGIAGAILSKNAYGSPEFANDVTAGMDQGMQAGTIFHPITDSGKQQTAALGQVLQQVTPAIPLTAEMGALARGAAPVKQLAKDTIAANLSRDALPIPKVEEPSGGAPTTSTPQTGGSPQGLPQALKTDDLVTTAKKAADGGFGSKKATEDLASAAAPDPKVAEAAKRLGIEDYLQPDHVTTSQGYREIAQAVKSIPGSQARAAEMEGLANVGKKASDLIDSLSSDGRAADVSSLDAKVKSNMMDTVKSLEDQADVLYTKVKEKIPQTAEAPAKNVLDFIGKRAEEVGGVEHLTPMEKRLYSKLSPKTETTTEVTPGQPAIPAVRGPIAGSSRQIQTEKQPTYALLDDQRRALGQVINRGSGPFKDADVGLAKKLYGLITQDQEAIVGPHGATELFNAAKSVVAQRKALENDLSSLYGKTLNGSIVGKINEAVSALPRGDTSKLINLIKATPEHLRQDVMAAGLATAMRSSAGRDAITFPTYARFYEGLLRNKQAYTAVASNLRPGAMKQLSDLYRVSDAISKASRERITTGRIAAVNEGFKVADNLMARIYDAAQRHAISAGAGTAAGFVFGPGVGAAVGSALSKGAKTSSLKAADALISSPQFLNLVKAADAPPRIKQAAVKEFARSPAFTKFAKSLNSAEVSDRERWIAQAMQSIAVQPPSGQIKDAPRPTIH